MGSADPRPGRELSLWLDQLAASGRDAIRRRPPLGGDESAEVCIVGGGLTGLWTAYYLTELDPSLDVLIVEKEFVGYGASGRNGGWCSALFPRGTASLERTHGRAAALAQRRAMIDTVAEVGRVVEAEGIDCDFRRGGTIAFARSAVQDAAARADVAEAAGYGVDPLEYWDASHVAGFGAAATVGASFDPNCARVQPAALVRGLAEVLERRGVRIVEGTAVTGVRPREVQTEHGRVRAAKVVLATEAYGSQLGAVGRRILPLYSLMIATEPLPESVWAEIGVAHGQTFTDYRHLLIYGQRTADDRIAFGGRGARYHWGSSIRPGYDQVQRVFEHLHTTLGELFPATKAARITHRWGGALGVPRDWHASANYNERTGVGYAGGYVGDGLSTTNLAGRTLADRMLGRSTALTRLPWTDHVSPRWEPEPLRFLGSNVGLLATAAADEEERRTGRPSRIARAVAPLVGH
ncbi:FAD-dependent oxidoreductase [Microbacteriaceae bacterium VKM Ac-2854]|nr:FAD-dependent oxidoreductase [Microbacteriaceae bacterium VKM Ac-2854]